MREDVPHRAKRACGERQYPNRPLRLRTFRHAFHQQFGTARVEIIDVGAYQMTIGTGAVSPPEVETCLRTEWPLTFSEK